MCTAVKYNTSNTYFGRNLDIEKGFNERILITPRSYEINFHAHKKLKIHYAILGIGTLVNNYPLYADAINEKGLAIAGLKFINNAKYFARKKDKINIASYELILYILGTFTTVHKAKKALVNLNITDQNFSKDLPNSPLHFILSDKFESIVIEQTETGLHLYDNPYEILTNNPTFEVQLDLLNKYSHLTNGDPKEQFIKGLPYESNGLGALSLPGDYSSASRFIKALFVKNYLLSSHKLTEQVRDFFKILESVSMPYGCVLTDNGYEYTLYSSCYDLTNITLYYKTYENPMINCLSLKDFDYKSKEIISIPLNRFYRIFKTVTHIG